jgi:hypothetical protein
MSRTDDKPAHQTEKVGYGNPPRHTRFKKGQSGNPEGGRRHRKKPSIAELVFRILNEKVPVRVDGEQKWKTRIEVAIHKQTQNAMNGSRLALNDLVRILSAADDAMNGGAEPEIRYANFPPRAATMEEWEKNRQGSAAPDRVPPGGNSDGRDSQS